MLFLQLKNISWLPQELLVGKVPNNPDSCFSMALLKLDCDTFLLKISSTLAARQRSQAGRKQDAPFLPAL